MQNLAGRFLMALNYNADAGLKQLIMSNEVSDTHFLDCLLFIDNYSLKTER